MGWLSILVKSKTSKKDLVLSQFDRTGFSAEVNTKVKKVLGNIIFQYGIYNEINSLKKIENFYLESNINSFKSISIPIGRDLFESRYGFITLLRKDLIKKKLL